MIKEKIISHIDKEFLSGNHDEYTVAMIKPDGVSFRLMEEFENELKSESLFINFCFPVYLRKETIYQAFKILREESDFTDNWQADVAEALSAGPSLVYISPYF